MGWGKNNPQATAHLSRVEDFGEEREKGVLLRRHGHG